MTKYRPRSKRYPLDERADDEAEGTCGHDGDCLRVGCDECVARGRVPPPRQCPAIGTRRSFASFCGCVEKRCAWFTQTLRLQTLSTVQDLAVQLSGEAVKDAAVVSRVAELLEQQLDLQPCYLRFKELLPARHRFVVTAHSQYGVTDASVAGAAPRLQRCVDEAFAKLLFAPSELSARFPNTEEVRISGVVEVQMGYGVPDAR